MSARYTPWAPLLLVTAALSFHAPAGAGDPRKADKPSISDLSLEVNALYALYSFKMTDSQLAELKKLARQTGQKPRQRKAGPVSEEFRTALVGLREALIANEDPDTIDSLGEQLEQIEKAELPDLDDGVELTPAARRQAVKVLHGLTVRQLANYIADNVEDLAGPGERLTHALGEAGKLDDKEWQRLRKTTVTQVGWLIAGLHEERAAQVSKQVGELLDRARELKGKKEAGELAELEKEARKIRGDITPTQVLRHILEHAVAELLANPRLEEVIGLRLKAAAAGA
jgi:hypothetical protein